MITTHLVFFFFGGASGTEAPEIADPTAGWRTKPSPNLFRVHPSPNVAEIKQSPNIWRVHK